MPERDTNQIAQGNEIIAFFPDQSDAFSAISELKEAGFTSEQIGLAIGGQAGSSTMAGRSDSDVVSRGHLTEDSRSMWDKIKDFFSGEHESYRGAHTDYEASFSHLSSSPDQARYYSSGIAAGGALVTVRVEPGRMAAAREILLDNDADLRTSGFDQLSGENISGANLPGRNPDATPGSEMERRLELRGELLRAVKQRVQAGEIRLRKDVITENQTINVPVTREDVIVEHVPAQEAGRTPASGRPIGEGEEIRIPVSEERVSVTKEPVVTGEVRVQKRAVQDTQQVSDTVRREEVRVENEGNVPVTDKITDKTPDKIKTGKKKPAA
jgi:uncharacterized protein (TIGR02271 family)